MAATENLLIFNFKAISRNN